MLLWYLECLSYSYMHSAYLIMIFIKNSKKKLICAFFITIYRVPALFLYVECLLYYNLPVIYHILYNFWQNISSFGFCHGQKWRILTFSIEYDKKHSSFKSKWLFFLWEKSIFFIFDHVKGQNGPYLARFFAGM